MIRIVVLVVIVLAAIGLIWSSAGPSRAAVAASAPAASDPAASAPAASDPAASAKPDDSLPVCVATIDQAMAVLTRDGNKFAILPDELLPAFLEIAVENGLKVQGKVTKVLLATLNGQRVFGVEVDGRCFSNPLQMNFEFDLNAPAPAKDNLSGKQPDGKVFS